MVKINQVYDEVVKFQSRISGLELPTDSINWTSHNVHLMVEELGEFVKEDKRWKAYRNSKFDREGKLGELADIFLTAFNLTIYGGYTSDELEQAILNKIAENNLRLDKG